MVYNAGMPPDYPKQPKWAVYYGTIKLDDGSTATYTAAQIATLYNLGADPYLAVPLVGANPFKGRDDEVSYYHLKPQRNGAYYDAKVRYNTSGAEYLEIDFDSKTPDRWTHRQRVDQSEDLI